MSVKSTQKKSEASGKILVKPLVFFVVFVDTNLHRKVKMKIYARRSYSNFFLFLRKPFFVGLAFSKNFGGAIKISKNVT